MPYRDIASNKIMEITQLILYASCPITMILAGTKSIINYKMKL